MNKDRLVKIGRILLSFLFLFSAISKLLSMPFFDDMVMEFLIGPDYFDHPKTMWWTQLFTRVLVAGELVIGLALLQNKWFKKLVMPALMAMLVLFTIHLFMEGFANDKGFVEGNCGCFGDVLPMTILESIIKNVIAIIIGIFVWRGYSNTTEQKFASWLAPVLLGLVTLFTLSFGLKTVEETPTTDTSEITTSSDIESEAVQVDSAMKNDELEKTESRMTSNPVASSRTEQLTREGMEQQQNNVDKPEQGGQTTTVDEINIAPEGQGMKDANDPMVDQDTETDAPSQNTISASQKTINLIQKHNSFSDGSKINFEKGTSLICMFSMSCSHCQEVYKELCELSDQLPKTFLINYGAAFEQAYFFKQAGSCKHPHNRMENFTEFKRLLEGSTYPRILVIKNGEITQSWDVDSYSRDRFMKYFGMKEPEKKADNDGGLQLETGDSPW